MQTDVWYGLPMMVKLSPEAVQALIAVGCNRQGAKVVSTPQVTGELTVAGLIGIGNGLTRKGTIARERYVNAALELAF